MKYLKPIYEEELIEKFGYEKIIGIDEVGRGSWAGPVAIGVYVYTKASTLLEGVTDSKKLTPAKREAIYDGLNKENYSVWYSSPMEIDKNGIGKALEELIQKAVNYYLEDKAYFLIDGQFQKEFTKNSEKVIKGDSKYYSIGLASIVSKVERDKIMSELDKDYSEFNFGKHKGYGTKIHSDAIKQYGVIKGIHRGSYKPIKAEINKRNLYRQ